MKVCMLQDVEHVGATGQVVKVKDGFARNFLLPQSLAVEVTKGSENFYAERSKRVEIAQEAIQTKMGMLAERIKNMHLSIKERAHDDGKLYGAVGADEVVELLAKKDVVVNKKQISFPKSIKTVGEHTVVVKLSSKLQPHVKLKVSEKEDA